MAIKEFKLISGATLQIDDMAAFESVVPLVETVKRVIREMAQQTGRTIEQVMEMEIGDAVGWNADVRKSCLSLFQWVIYDGARMSVALLNDHDRGASVRGDYQQIISYMVEVLCAPFFPRTSSGSTLPGEAHTSDQRSPLAQAPN